MSKKKSRNNHKNFTRNPHTYPLVFLDPYINTRHKGPVGTPTGIKAHTRKALLKSNV